MKRIIIEVEEFEAAEICSDVIKFLAESEHDGVINIWMEPAGDDIPL